MFICKKTCIYICMYIYYRLYRACILILARLFMFYVFVYVYVSKFKLWGLCLLISSEYWKNIWAQDPYTPIFSKLFWCAQESWECCRGHSRLSICSGRKNTGKLEGFPLCHGESTGAPEKQGPYEGTMVVFSSLDKALFPLGAWPGRLFGSTAPQKWR